MARRVTDIASDIIEVRHTESAGRGVFALRDIPGNTEIYATRPGTINLIYRNFRREVCNDCFAYDSGRTWKLSTIDSGVSLAWFCSMECREAWEARHDAVARKAWLVVEMHIQKARKLNDDADSAPEAQALQQPTVDNCDVAWSEASQLADRITTARKEQPTSKASTRILNSVKAKPIDTDHLCFLLSAILTAYSRPDIWELVEQLEQVDTPYHTLHHLASHITSFHILLALLPLELIPQTNVRVLRTVAAADVHNSFGVWSGTAGIASSAGEMLGYGVWPDASMFNHSCKPNIADRTRRGRCWIFRTSCDVRRDEELTISYLSREELRELDVVERRACLNKAWGFLCACVRCLEENVEHSIR